jgi:hypothetical protein
MTRGPRPGLGAYARALEQALSRARERPVVLSPRDWGLVADWHAREIPLAVVLEELGEASRRSRSRGRTPGPRSLAYIAAAVEESWSLILAERTRLTGTGLASSRGLSSARDAWERAARQAGQESDLGRLLSDLLGRLDGGASPAEVDAMLDDRLIECVPQARVARLEHEVGAELGAFRDRMPARGYERTRRRALLERLRRGLGLPRIGG